MADINKFTTKEVLNKVLLDSSGNSVAAFSHTTQEALNAVLDSTNSRLNVSLVGGTISGDVTISGDLTVEGDGVLTISETIQGKLKVVEGAGSLPSGIDTTTGDLIIAQNNNDTSDISAIYAIAGNAGSSHFVFGDADSKNPGRVSYDHSDDSMDLVTSSTVRMKLDSNSRISLSNNTSFDSGARNTVFGKNIGNIDVGSDENVFIGEEVASDATLSNANQNVIIGYKAGEDLTTADRSVFIGAYAGQEHSQGGGNVAIGYEAMHDNGGGNIFSNVFIGTLSGSGQWQSACVSNTAIGANTMLGAMDDADNNVAVGESALRSITLGDNNVAIGTESLRTLANGTMNVAIGNSALYSETGGDTTVAIGQTALYSQNVTSGVDSENTGVGYLASYYNVTGRYNTAIGSQALKGDTGQSHSYNTAVGHSSLLSITDGTANIGIGSFAGSLTTTGDNNIAIGSYDGTDLGALRTNVAGSFNIAIGTGALKLINDDANDGSVAIGHKAGFNKAGTGSQYSTPSVHIGMQSGAAQTTGAGNTSVGHASMAGNPTGTALTGGHNTVMGYSAGYLLQGAASYNTFIGSEAGGGFNNTGNDHNTAIGYQAGTGGNNQDIDDIVAVGSQALTNIDNNAADGAVAVGRSALAALTSGTQNTAVGFEAGKSLTNGGYNTFVGYEAGENVTDRLYNIAIGVQAMRSGGADGMVAIGYGALDATSSTDAVGSIGIGQAALGALTDGVGNIGIGYGALANENDGDFNTAVGYQALSNQEGRSGTVNNTAIGYRAGASMTNGYENTFVGSNAGAANTTGAANTIIGANTADALTIGDFNTAVGVNALGTEDVGRGSTAIGYGSLANMNSDSNDENTGNTALGFYSGYNVTTGTNNTLLGYEAGKDINTGSNNVVIGYLAGENVDSGIENTIVGVSAGDTITGGDYNTILGRLADGAATANGQIAVGYGALTSGAYGVRIGYSGTAQSNSTVIGGLSISSEVVNQTIIGNAGVFKFQSKEYDCDFASANEGTSASSDTTPLKLPAYSIIKSISVMVTQLANSGDYKVRIDLADDSGAVADAASYTNATEILGAGATDTCSGNSASAVDIDLGSGAVAKQSYYNGYAGAGLPVGTADKYVRIANGDHGTNTNPTTIGKIKVLVEYVGQD